MNRFWERSPEWWRLQEFCEALRVAERMLDEAEDPYWIERTKDDRDDAYVAWVEADKAFRASPAGQARARYCKDPLAVTAAESEGRPLYVSDYAVACRWAEIEHGRENKERLVIVKDDEPSVQISMVQALERKKPGETAKQEAHVAPEGEAA